jgi:hypothetical protein
MNLGNTGNGFDFLIDPYRHGGMPAQVTSVPYPLVAEASMTGIVEGAWDVSLLALIESMEGVAAIALSGTLRSILIAFTYGPDEIEAVMAVAQSGTLTAIRQSISGGPESIEGFMPVALTGSIARIRIVMNAPREDISGVAAIALSGTLV